MHRVLIAAVACAVLAVPAATAASAPRHTVDLATGAFDGHAVLGSTPAQVKAVLGRPDSAHGSKGRYELDWGKYPNVRFLVIFTKLGTSERAVTLGLETGVFLDPRIGDILEPKPPGFLAAMRVDHGDVYQLVNPLKHKPGGLYIGEFRQRDGTLHVSFGTHPKLGTFVTIWDWSG